MPMMITAPYLCDVCGDPGDATITVTPTQRGLLLSDLVPPAKYSTFDAPDASRQIVCTKGECQAAAQAKVDAVIALHAKMFSEEQARDAAIKAKQAQDVAGELLAAEQKQNAAARDQKLPLPYPGILPLYPPG